MDNTRNYRRGAVYFTELRFRPTTSINELLRKEDEWQSRLSAADALAHHYDTDVFVTPVFDNQFHPFYGRFYVDAPVAGKMPDLFFNNCFWELESYEGSFNPNHFTEMLRHGKKQSPNIVMKLNHPYDIDLLKRRAKGYMRTSNNQNTKNKIERMSILDVYSNIHEL